MTTPPPQDDSSTRPGSRPTGDPYRHPTAALGGPYEQGVSGQPPGSYPQDGPYRDGPYRDFGARQPVKRSTGRVVAAIVLLVIGALASLLALLATVVVAGELGESANPAYLLGRLFESWLVAAVFVVPGLLLLRRPRR